MGKKIVAFGLLTAIICGIIVGAKSVKIIDNKSNSSENIEEEIEEVYRDELNLSISNLETLNPLKNKNTAVANVLKLIYEPLISYASDEQIEYVLAESIEKIDSNTWIIKLRDNVKWHSGLSFSKDDVLFTINILKDNNFTYSENVKNIKAIESLSENTLKIILNNSDDFFPSKLIFPILPEYYFKGNNFNDESRASKFVGTGPYKYVSANDDVIELNYNLSWWKNEKAKLNKIYVYKYATYGEEIKAFKSTKIDMITTNISNWKEKFGTIGINSYSFENSEYEMILPNCNIPQLSENSVRRAIISAINRENIVSSIYNDNASVSDVFIHTNSKNSINNAEYDVEKAKQILINAGWVQGEDGWSKEINKKRYYLKFTLLVNKENENKVAVSEKIKNDLEEVGILITINKVSKEKLEGSIQNDNFELALASIDIKNENFVIDLVSAENEYNYANYNSSVMEKIIEKLKIDDLSYEENIYNFVMLLKNDAPYIGLYFKSSTILTNKSVKGNMMPSWENPFKNIISFCK